MAPLTWFSYNIHVGERVEKQLLGILFGFGLASLFLIATEARHFPECLARSFTVATKMSGAVQIGSTWVCGVLVLGPAIPILIFGFVAGVFDHSFFPNRTGHDLIYTTFGIGAGLIILGLGLFIPSGFRCEVSKNHVVWVSTYFGKDARIREYPNVCITEYSLTNGEAGGPVVTIEFDGKDGKRSTAKLKFRNLYQYSCEEFGDLLAQHLGEPERRTTIPTKNGHQPVLAEPTE